MHRHDPWLIYRHHEYLDCYATIHGMLREVRGGSSVIKPELTAQVIALDGREIPVAPSSARATHMIA